MSGLEAHWCPTIILKKQQTGMTFLSAEAVSLQSGYGEPLLWNLYGSQRTFPAWRCLVAGYGADTAENQPFLPTCQGMSGKESYQGDLMRKPMESISVEQMAIIIHSDVDNAISGTDLSQFYLEKDVQ